MINAFNYKVKVESKARNLTFIFWDMMNIKDKPRLRDSYLQNKKKHLEFVSSSNNNTNNNMSSSTWTHVTINIYIDTIYVCVPYSTTQHPKIHNLYNLKV